MKLLKYFKKLFQDLKNLLEETEFIPCFIVIAGLFMSFNLITFCLGFIIHLFGFFINKDTLETGYLTVLFIIIFGTFGILIFSLIKAFYKFFMYLTKVWKELE
jgi:hypothetical protein